jgi:hypothetical protein
MTTFEKLSAIDVNKHVEKKNGLSYLSWAWAWSVTKKTCPDASYRIGETEYDEQTGFMCHTHVTIDGETMEMWLPVMDGANKSMKKTPYTYKTKYGDKQVEAATSFDINKTIMRCLVKNLAMFGLGLYIYAGEDLPEAEVFVEKPKETKIVTLDIGDDNWVKVLKYISSVKELGLEKIVENLSTKYAISTVVKKEIAKAIK